MDDIALFDMDGSLANYTAALVRNLRALQSPQEEPVTEENIWFLEKEPYVAERLKLIKSVPGWWLNLEPIDNGMLVLDLCRMLQFDIHILTKGPKKHSLAWKEKVEWCQKHIHEDADVHITSNKKLTYGKMLYDDYPEYMTAWLAHRPRGLGIMPVTPFNKDFQHPNVIKYEGLHDLERIAKALTACKNRKSGEMIAWKNL